MKYYYTDVLAAAWMAKHFGMKLQKGVFGYGEGVTTYLTLLDAAGNEAWKYRYYIHPDSLPLLEPKEGDVVICRWGKDAAYALCGRVRNVFEGEVVRVVSSDEDPDYSGLEFNYDATEIIQRNGKAFFMPESGE